VPETEVMVMGKSRFTKIFWTVITMQRMAKFFEISKELLEGFGYKSSLMNWKTRNIENGIAR